MPGLKKIQSYTEYVVNICPDNTEGEVIEIDGLHIQLPAVPPKKEIIGHDLPKAKQMWQRLQLPKDLLKVRSMDDWMEQPKEFRDKYSPVVELEFYRRRNGVWFYNNGVPTYITGRHYMMLQWSKMDIGYPNYLAFQRKIFLHFAACEADPRCIGQLYVKCRRSGYTNISSSILVDEGTQVKEKLLGIQSKTGKDAQENIFMKKVVPMFKSYPFFFKPIQDGTTNPRMELAFREPSKRITKSNKTSVAGEALDTVINWKNTTTNAYDGEKLHILYLDECFAPGTKILMSDMSFKNIEDIRPGEIVMVDGGKKVEVAKTFSGFDNMYKVSQPYGRDYAVNSKHRLVLRNYHHGEILITPDEYLSKSDSFKRHTTRVTSKPIELPERSFELEPYFLGLWLGDGHSSGRSFVLNIDTDHEVIEYISDYVGSLGGTVSIHDVSNSSKAKNVYISFGSIGSNQATGSKHKMFKSLKDMYLIRNKHIPESYMNSSISQRLQLLAGIIDTDGHLNSKNTYEIYMSRKELVFQIYNLAKSCGLDVSEVAEKNTNFNTTSYGIRITGDESIPCRLQRKKSSSGDSYKSRRAKMDVTPVGFGEYFGIQLKTDDDSMRRLILEDYTVSMNCGKWEKPADIREAWRIESTCLIVGKRVVGKALLGSTVNPLDKGGKEFRDLYYDSNPSERNKNGRTRSGLYHLFIPAYDALEGFFDVYGNAIADDPKEPVQTIEGDYTDIGARTYLRNERDALLRDPYELNEKIRQFPFTIDEAFRDSTERSLFNVGKIYEQMTHNQELFPSPVIKGNFSWENGIPDTRVIFNPDANGRWVIAWIPPADRQNIFVQDRGGKKSPPQNAIGVGGVDSYDIDATVDGRGSKGACHIFNKFNMNFPSNMFVAEYSSRPPMAKIFYEDILMAAVFYGYPLLVENNKYGIVRYFEQRGYDNYLMDRPEHLGGSTIGSRTKGVPSNSQDFIHSHAQAIEAFIHTSVGYNPDTGEMGKMYFDRTLEDWIGFRIDNRTKFDLTISAGLALLAAQKIKQEEKKTNFSEKKFFRTFKPFER
jgi:hypothetical protein